MSGFEELWETISLQLGAGGDPALTVAPPPASEPLSPSPLPFLDPTQADSDFVVREAIGTGGMGKVELALQRSLEREVAIKTLHAGAEPRAARALLEEARVSGALEHPNIVPVHLLGLDAAGRPILVMKRVVGDAWEDLLADPGHARWESLGEDRLAANLRILQQVCNALSFAHSRGVVHRDVKPANVMLGDFGEVYLLDWGLGLRLEARDPARKDVVGTPAYLAPEQLLGEGAIEERTDVYLLGATLHRVVTGAPRHRGSLRQALASAHTSRPQSYDADVPAELAQLMNAATHADLAQRPASPEAFRVALEEFLGHRGSLELSERAARHLDELRAALAASAPDPGVVSARLGECRFGFEQALRDWPENAAARAGLQEALELACEHELARRNKGLVESLLAGLPDPRPDLRARLDVLRAELEEEARSRLALQRMEHELDPSVSGAQRAKLVGAWGVFSAVGAAAIGVSHRNGWVEVTPLRGLYLKLLLALAILLILAHYRRSLLVTEMNRRLAASAVATLVAMLLGHGVGLLLGLDIGGLVAVDAVVMAMCCGSLGAFVDARLFLLVPFCAAVAIADALAPAYSYEIGSAGAVLGFAYVAALWARSDPGGRVP